MYIIKDKRSGKYLGRSIKGFPRSREQVDSISKAFVFSTKQSARLPITKGFRENYRHLDFYELIKVSIVEQGIEDW